MWKKINNLLGKNTHESAPKEISANNFNSFFANIGRTVIDSTNISNAPPAMPWKNPPCVYKFKFECVQICDVYKMLSKLSTNSSIDCIGFDSKLLFLAREVIAPILTVIINSSLANGTVPHDWKFARVTPVYKGKGSKNDVNNYRPISVIGHVAKLTERVVQHQLLSYLLSHDLISIDQSAFRPKHSTQTALHRVVDAWLDNMQDKMLTGVCFLDIKKCFDTIDHELLLRKLMLYGIENVEWKWFNEYLKDRSQFVRHNGVSLTEYVNAGVPQGSALSCVLFTIFINDLSQFSGDCTCNLYADDAVIYCHDSNNARIQQKLQNSVLNVSEWYNGNRLALNAQKCEVMVLKTKRSNASDNLDIVLNDVHLNQVKCSKYLGLNIDHNLSWNEYISCLC